MDITKLKKLLFNGQRPLVRILEVYLMMNSGNMYRALADLGVSPQELVTIKPNDPVHLIAYGLFDGHIRNHGYYSLRSLLEKLGAVEFETVPDVWVAYMHTEREDWIEVYRLLTSADFARRL